MIFDRWGKQDIVLSSTLYLNYEFRSLGKAGYCSVLHTVLGNYEIRLNGRSLSFENVGSFYIK